MVDVGHALFNGFIEWGEDGKPHPELAESLELTNGAKDWILNVHEEIKFSNGQEFTADDAVYSLNLHRGQTKSGGAGKKKKKKKKKKKTSTRYRFRLPRPTPTCRMHSRTFTSSLCRTGSSRHRGRKRENQC